MPAFPNIENYHASLAELIEAGGSDNELSIRPAFQNCLAAYCAAHRDKLVLEVWPESHRPGFALRQADVFQSYMAQ